MSKSVIGIYKREISACKLTDDVWVAQLFLAFEIINIHRKLELCDSSLFWSHFLAIPRFQSEALPSSFLILCIFGWGRSITHISEALLLSGNYPLPIHPRSHTYASPGRKAARRRSYFWEIRVICLRRFIQESPRNHLFFGG